MEHRVALLIGQQKYDARSGFDELKGCHVDIERTAAVLERHCSFEAKNVIKFKDAKKGDFDTLRKFLLQTLEGTAGALVIFYYAGHGLSIAGQTHLVPVDAQSLAPETYVNVFDFLQPLHDIALLKGKSIPMRAAVEASASPAPGAFIFVILDTCREPQAFLEADLRGKLSAGSSLRPKDSQICFLLACDDGASCSDQGYLTEAFLHSIEALPGRQLFNLLEATIGRCQERTGFRQRPWYNASTRSMEHLVLNQGGMPSAVVAKDSGMQALDYKFCWLRCGRGGRIRGARFTKTSDADVEEVCIAISEIPPGRVCTWICKKVGNGGAACIGFIDSVSSLNYNPGKLESGSTFHYLDHGSFREKSPEQEQCTPTTKADAGIPGRQVGSTVKVSLDTRISKALIQANNVTYESSLLLSSDEMFFFISLVHQGDGWEVQVEITHESVDA